MLNNVLRLCNYKFAMSYLVHQFKPNYIITTLNKVQLHNNTNIFNLTNFHNYQVILIFIYI